MGTPGVDKSKNFIKKAYTIKKIEKIKKISPAKKEIYNGALEKEVMPLKNSEKGLRVENIDFNDNHE